MTTTKTPLDEIYGELIAGDESARERLIGAALPLARMVAGRQEFCRGDTDDLIGQAYLVLTETVQRLDVSRPGDNIRSLLITAIRNRLSDYVAEDCLIGPSSSQRKRLKGAYRSPDTSSLIEESDQPARREPSNTLGDILELCETDREREIIAKRAEEKTAAEIAEEIGVTQPTVSRAIRRIEARYNEACLALGA
jgi:RNA polymerase sigma factor (sigma-70 family)